MNMTGYVLILTADDPLADALVTGLRQRRLPALSVDTSDRAITIARDVALRAIVMDIERAADWHECSRLVPAAGHAFVVALTSWTAPDGRYRRRAFNSGCAAVVAKPCSLDALVTVLERLDAGERQVEVVTT